MRGTVLIFVLALGCAPAGSGSIPDNTPSSGTPVGLPSGTPAGTPAGTPSGTQALLPTERVDIDNYRRLMEDRLYTHLGDNRGFGPEHDLARANIVEELEATGLAVVLEPFGYDNTTYYNVVATQVGTDDSALSIVVGAHFDSVDNPGADDNATGTALVLEMARVLSQYEVGSTITYVLFDREEQGLVGSRAFATAHSDAIEFALTADMIGQDHGDYAVDLFSTASSVSLVARFDSAIGVYGGGLDGTVLTGNQYGFSDHQAFEERGIPAFVIIEGDYSGNPHYHQDTDALETSAVYVNYDYVADTLRAVVGFLGDEAGVVVP